MLLSLEYERFGGRGLARKGMGLRNKHPVGVTALVTTQPKGYPVSGLRPPGSLGQPQPRVPGDLNRIYTRFLTVEMSFKLGSDVRLSKSKMGLPTA